MSQQSPPRRSGSGLGRFLRAEEGASAVEYALVAGMISIMVVGILALGGQLGTLFDSLSGYIPETGDAPVEEGAG